jgi:O-antigen biosynthesis protein
MDAVKLFEKAIRLIQRGDLKTLQSKVFKIYYNYESNRKYLQWLNKNGNLSDSDKKKLFVESENFSLKPKISIILPVYNVEEIWLRKCLDSVCRQIYRNWELCIVDDCSPSPHIRKVLEEYAAKDERIKTVFRENNGHISVASNSALALATGEFTALLDHDDEITEDALFRIAEEYNKFPETDFFFTDEDMMDASEGRFKPKFKPDFSRELFYSVNYLTHLAVYRTELLKNIGGFRIGTEGSQDYDLALRVIEEIPEKRIRHIPRILYHWRAIRGSVALSSDEKPYAHERAREAIRAHLERSGKRAKVVETGWNFHRVRYELPEVLPKVGLIIYSEHTSEQNCVENLLDETDYDNLETILVNRSNAEKLNLAAMKSVSEVLVFVDANLKPLAKDWLKELISFAIQKEIGAVGAKILSRNETILHGGLIVGTNDIVSAAHRGFERESEGNMFRLHLANNFSAVSVACLCVRKSLFEEIGGFGFKHLPNKFFDADFCLKLREKDYRIVFTPYAELAKIDDKKRSNFEQSSTAEEREYFTNKWREKIEYDPFYNPNLSKKDAGFSIGI